MEREGGKDAIRLLFLPLDRWRVYVIVKVSNGKDGWLWYTDDNETRTGLICALATVTHGGIRGLQLALGPLAVFVLWASRDARKVAADARVS